MKRIYQEALREPFALPAAAAAVVYAVEHTIVSLFGLPVPLAPAAEAMPLAVESAWVTILGVGGLVLLLSPIISTLPHVRVMAHASLSTAMLIYSVYGLVCCGTSTVVLSLVMAVGFALRYWTLLIPIRAAKTHIREDDL